MKYITIFIGLKRCTALRRAPLATNTTGQLQTVTDFALNGCFRKIFGTKSAEIVQNRMMMFNCLSVQECVAKRRINFLLIILHRTVFDVI